MPTYTAQTDRPLGAQITALQKGDTLILPNGTYAIGSGATAPTSVAVPEAAIVAAAEGARPILIGLPRFSGNGYALLELDFRWPSGASKSEHHVRMNGGTGWRMLDCTILGAHSYAALHLTGDARDFEIAYCEFGDVAKSNDTNQDHAIYASDTIGGVLHHCLMRDTPNGRGLKLGNSGGGADAGPDGMLIEYCTFLRNTGPSSCQFSYLARNNTVRRCVSIGSGSDGFTTTSLSGRGNVVEDCIVWQPKTGKVGTSEAGLTIKPSVRIADPANFPDYGYLAGTTLPPDPDPTPDPTPDPDPTPTPEDTELAALRAEVARMNADLDACAARVGELEAGATDAARDRAVLLESLANVTIERDAQRSVLKQIATLASAY